MPSSPQRLLISPTLSRHLARSWSFLLLLGLLLGVPAIGWAQTPPDDPSNGPPTWQTNGGQSKPIQVYIMLGQSNMLGFGKVGPESAMGTLENLVRQKGMYPEWVSAENDWVTREDVRYVHVMHRRDKMQKMRDEWLTPKGSFGPELGFGHVMGEFHSEPVLLLKACIGNRSLGWDLLPPGSESYEYEGKIYAGYKQSPLSWDKGTEPEPIDWYAGKQYDDDVRNAKAVLNDLADYFPGYQDQGYEIAGFVWWQGHKDQNPAHASRYEQNLVRLIKTLKRDFDAPDAKFVLATIAFEGENMSGHALTIVDAQLAVDGQNGNYPEFRGQVKAVDARPFWRSKDVSPNQRQGFHYFHNAETYMEVGKALGEAMKELQAQTPDE